MHGGRSLERQTMRLNHTMFAVKSDDEPALQAVNLFIGILICAWSDAFNDRELASIHRFLKGAMFQDGQEGL